MKLIILVWEGPVTINPERLLIYVRVKINFWGYYSCPNNTVLFLVWND